MKKRKPPRKPKDMFGCKWNPHDSTARVSARYNLGGVTIADSAPFVGIVSLTKDEQVHELAIYLTKLSAWLKHKEKKKC